MNNELQEQPQLTLYTGLGAKRQERGRLPRIRETKIHYVTPAYHLSSTPRVCLIYISNS
jgi:hypothetical protein